MTSSDLDGRGTRLNPVNRFERLHVDLGDVEEPDALAPPVPTELYRDASRTVLAENDSPDIGFRFSLNPYRGCEHGCIYCYARPSHEYSASAPASTSSAVSVKSDAPERLRDALASPRWHPEVIALSGNTDCYQPVERRLKLTRGCLEVLREFRNPVGVITKSAWCPRDVLGSSRSTARRTRLSITCSTRSSRAAWSRARPAERRLQACRCRAGVPSRDDRPGHPRPQRP
jgi:DNA repair photolyase